MLILNFLLVCVFAIVGEILRNTVFQTSKIFKKAAQAPKPAAGKKVEGAAVSQDHSDIKNEALRNLVESHFTLQSKRADLEVQKKECEKFNNQDTYAKYAKM